MSPGRAYRAPSATPRWRRWWSGPWRRSLRAPRTGPSGSWLQLVQQLDRIHDPAALPSRLATVTRRECLRVLSAARGPLAGGYGTDVEIIPDVLAGMAEQELVVAERHAALHEAMRDLPKSGQQLMLLLIEDPPLPYTEISARLGIAVGSIGPTRSRCLNKLRRHPAIAALTDTDSGAA